MSILLTKVVWYRVDEEYSEAHNITDTISFDTGNGLDIKNNVLTLNLKNSIQEVRDFGGDIGVQPVCTHITGDSSTIEFRFEERDMIKLYLKYSDDASELESAAWSNGVTTLPDATDLIGTYYITDYTVTNEEKSSNVKLVCADKTFILFNKILAKSFLASEGLTTPELVQKVVQLSAQASKDQDPNMFGTGAKYEIDATIDNTSPYTGIQGKRTGGIDFPVKSMAKVWKPIYEWISELSQIDYLNSDTELSDNTLVYTRPFIFYVDENNVFHWFETSETIDDTFIVGSDDKIVGLSLKKSVFDVKNMLIFNAGTDVNGHGILDYKLDLTSNIAGLKMQYVPMVDIAKKYLDNDYQLNTTASNREGNGYPFPQYPLAGSYPTDTAWSDNNLSDEKGDIGNATSNGTYNTTLRRACKYRGQERATNLLKGLADARFKGSIDLYGQKSQAGTLISVTDTRFGILNQRLRIQDVKHTVTKTGWFTRLSIEEDEKAIVSE